MSHEATVRRLLKDLASLDAKAVVSHCADDCVYEDVPYPEHTVVGPAAIQARLERGLAGIERLEQQIHELVVQGDTVLMERTGIWHHPTGERVPVPLMAVFKFRGDKIVLWRDYWDVATLMNNQPASWIERMRAEHG